MLDSIAMGRAPAGGRLRAPRRNGSGMLGLEYEARDTRLFAVMRFVLACAALIIIYIDPTEPRSKVELTYSTLAMYCVYGAGVLAVSLHRPQGIDQRFFAAIDVLFAAALILLTDGTNSIFFYAFLFPILVVSFAHGFRDGLICTVGCVAMFVITAAMYDPPLVHFELNLALIRPLYLFAFGYMVAVRGGRQIRSRQRLMLLKQVEDPAAAEAPVDEIIDMNLRRIRAFYNAERCVLVLARQPREANDLLYTVGRATGPIEGAQEVKAEAAASLLGFAEHESVLFSAERSGRFRFGARCLVLDETRKRDPWVYTGRCGAAAALLEAQHFVCVPYSEVQERGGRLYLISNRAPFKRQSVQFLRQFSTAMANVVANRRLMDEIVHTAAERERLLISRDIHDAAVQPYIGLRMGLEALYKDAGDGHPLASRMLELIEMVNTTVHELRTYTRGLEHGPDLPGGSLERALQMQAARCKRYYGVEVAVEVPACRGATSERVASQIFHIAIEGLSNVVRHTPAKRARVSVRQDAGAVYVEIANEAGGRAANQETFVPRSIASRVGALGGVLEVRRDVQGHTIVQARIPT